MLKQTMVYTLTVTVERPITPQTTLFELDTMRSRDTQQRLADAIAGSLRGFNAHAACVGVTEKAE